MLLVTEAKGAQARDATAQAVAEARSAQAEAEAEAEAEAACMVGALAEKAEPKKNPPSSQAAMVAAARVRATQRHPSSNRASKPLLAKRPK